MSHDPSDCYEHGRISTCCGDRVMLGDICACCKEHCDSEPTEPAEREFSQEQLNRIAELEKDARQEP